MPNSNLTLSGIMASIEDNLSLALSEIEKFNNKNPNDIRGWRVRASIMLRKNDAAGLKKACIRALQIDETCVISRSLLGLGSALDGEYKLASLELQKVCRIAPTGFNFIELGTYLHLSGDPQSAFKHFNSAKKLSKNKKDIRNLCLSIFGALRSADIKDRKDEYFKQKKMLLILYQKQPNLVSSVILNYFNTRDFYKWKYLKEKDELALFFQSNSAVLPDGLNVPKGFILPKQVLDFQNFQSQCHVDKIFIAKETGLFGGQGITLHSRERSIPSNFTGVIQSYIENPLLVEGKKAHMRLYLIFLSYRPLQAYFWKNGIVRFAPEAYLPKKGWLSNSAIHITNTALNQNHSNIKLLDNSEIEDDGSIWGLTPYVNRISANRGESDQIWGRLYQTASGFVNLLREKGFFSETSSIPNNALIPKIIGFDALLDSDKKVWFLEIQRNPGQTGKGPINKINSSLYRAVFKLTFDTIERKMMDKKTTEFHKSFIPIQH